MDDKEIRVEEKRAMICLPENAVEVNIIATVYEDGKIEKISKRLNTNDIYKAFDDADKNYVEDTDIFQVTEEGLKWLEQIRSQED